MDDSYDPTNDLSRAFGLASKGRHAEAAEMFNKPIRTLVKWARKRPEIMGTPNPDPSDKDSGYALLGIAYAHRAESLAAIGRMKDARHSADLATKCAGAHPDIHRMRARIYLKSGKHDRVEKMIDRVIALDPGDDGAHATKANLMFSRGDPEGALLRIEEALRLNPSGSHSYQIKSVVLDALGRREDALEAADTAVRLDPKNEAAQKIQSIMRARAGGSGPGDAGPAAVDPAATLGARAGGPPAVPPPAGDPVVEDMYARAGAAMRRAAEAGNSYDPGADMSRACDLMAEGKNEQAVKVFDKPIGMLTSSAYAMPEMMGTPNAEPSAGDGGYALLGYAYAWRGEALMALGRDREARDSVDRAAEYANLHPDIRRIRAKVYLKTQKFKEAAGMVEDAIEIDPKNSAVHVLKAALLISQKDYRGGLASADEAVRLAPEDSESHKMRATALDGLRRYGDALDEVDEAVRLSPEEPSVHQLRSVIRTRLGDYEGAKSAIEMAMHLDPTNPAHKMIRDYAESAAGAARGE